MSEESRSGWSLLSNLDEKVRVKVGNWILGQCWDLGGLCSGGRVRCG